MQRKYGYYWVRINEKVMPTTLGDSWIIALWNGNSWFIPGFLSEVWDAMFKEIDEKQITK